MGKVTGHTSITKAGKDGSNYIPMGFWSATADYYMSDLGIPFVKRPDGSTLGYSVFALNVQQATKGSWIASQWRLLESAEFLYMQDAYIERLQAALVTAEKIQSLMISTSNIEILDGATVGGTLKAKDGYFEGLVRNPYKNYISGIDWWQSADGSHPILLTNTSSNLLIKPNSIAGYTINLPQGNINGYKISVLNMCTEAPSSLNNQGNVVINAGNGKIMNPLYDYNPLPSSVSSTMTLGRGEYLELIGVENMTSSTPNFRTSGWIVVGRLRVLPVS